MREGLGKSGTTTTTQSEGAEAGGRKKKLAVPEMARVGRGFRGPLARTLPRTRYPQWPQMPLEASAAVATAVALVEPKHTAWTSTEREGDTLFWNTKWPLHMMLTGWVARVMLEQALGSESPLELTRATSDPINQYESQMSHIERDHNNSLLVLYLLVCSCDRVAISISFTN